MSQNIDPIQALDRLLSLRHDAPPNDHLFAFTTPGKHRTSIPTKEAFLKRVNEIWSRHGITRHSGHAFRIGGTTALLKAGVPPDVVRKMGRWASDAYLRYWRDLAEIASSHAELLDNPHDEKPADPPQDGRGATSRTIRTPRKLRQPKGRSS